MKTDSEILEQENSHVPSSVPGSFILNRFEQAQSDSVETADDLVMTKVHSGREFYVNQANQDIYMSLMGEKPTEIDGRAISEHAIKKGLQFIKANDCKLNTECLSEYKSICNSHQDKIDKELESLQMFDVPTSALELEKQLEVAAHKAGLSLESLRLIKQARQNESVLRAFEAVGIVSTKVSEREEPKEISKRVEILRQQRGRGKIHASLLAKSESSYECS